MLRRAYKFRLYPNRRQQHRLYRWLELCGLLYNACLQQRREGWKRQRKSVGLLEQTGQLPEMKQENPEFKRVNAQVLQDVCRRVDRAFDAFFRRVKQGKKPGYPRYRSRHRYRSFTHPQADKAKWRQSHLYLPSFGWIRWKYTPPPAHIERVKTITIKREADGFYAVLSCVVTTPQPLPPTGKAVGIDLGLTNLVATSDGQLLGELAPLKEAERRLRKAQRNVARKRRGSNRRRKAVKVLARRHQDLARRRQDQLHRISKKLVEEYDVIVFEDLDIQQLANSGPRSGWGRGLRRNFRHAALASLIWMLTYKAESAGRRAISVDPRGTSQLCSGCGRTVSKQLWDRWHDCPRCGLKLDRDTNAARNILNRGLHEALAESRVADSLKREVGKEANA